VANVLSTVPLNIFFRRNLGDMNLRDWHRIVASLPDLNLHEERDTFVWLQLHLVRLFYTHRILPVVRGVGAPE
jgi:hypothetical protein